MGFVVDKVAMGQVSLSLSISASVIIPPMLYHRAIRGHFTKE
jgi:hypothetical protein